MPDKPPVILRLHTFRPILQALRLVWRSTRSWTLAYFALLLLQAVLPLAILYLTKAIVDALTQGGGDFRAVAGYIGLLAGVWLLISALQSLTQYVSEAQQHLFLDYMAGVLQEKSIAMDLGYYENPEYLDTFHKAQQQASYRPMLVLSDLFNLLQNALSLATLAGLLLFLHWGVALLLLFASAPSVFIKLRFARRLYEWERRRTRLERRAWYINDVLTSGAHAKEVRLFGYGGRLIERYRRLVRRLFTEKTRILRQRTAADLGGKVAEVGAIAAAYGFTAWRTLQGAITIGSLVMYFQAFQRGQSHLQQLFQSLARLYQHRLFLGFLFDFLDLEPRVTEAAAPRPLPRPLRQGIRFEGVSFRYPLTEQEVLRDVTIELRPGEVIALVGPNGSGKTTLLKLLCRLYDPTAGAVTLDGVDLREAPLADVRGRMGIIFQDFSKYHLTAAENIRLGDPARPDDPAAVAAAARHSGADEVIGRLPHGYDTLLGRHYEDGAELSGGQWQKIALARAFYRDAEIVVLDEPTSAIDPLAEYEIFARLRELARGRILILVTHRLYNLQLADRIVVMDEGRVAESGAHNDLMARQGLYYRMFEKQRVR